MPDTTALNGTTIALDITANDFDSIVSMQFSINWDTDVLEYESFERIDLDNVAVGDLQAPNGELRLSWFDLEGVGKTLVDGSIIARFFFNVPGPPGSSTQLPITDIPLAIQIYTAGSAPGLYDPVALVQDTGRVTVVSPADVAVDVTDVSCGGLSDGAIAVTVQTAPQGYTLHWSGPNNFSADTEDIANLEGGDYVLQIRDADGQVIYQVTYTVMEPTPLQINQITTEDAFCSEPIGSVSISVTGGTTPLVFDFGQGTTPDSTLSGLVSGDYHITITDANNCSIDTSFTIGGPVAPEINLPDTTTLCTGQGGLLDAGQHLTILWSTGDTTSTINIDQIGVYSVTVTDANGCTTADTTLAVTGTDIDVSFSNLFTEICQGDSLELQATGADTYEWIDTSGTLSALDIPFPTATPQYNTTYTVIGTSACGVDTASIDITVIPVTATAGPDSCIGPGIQIQLYASGGQFYQWADAAYPVSDKFIPNPFIQPEGDTTVYVVTIVDANGCITVDSVNILVSNSPLNIKAINLITPNGDGKNDDLDFGHINKFGANSLKVYNRWGDLIYQKVNYQSDSERFDGTYKDKPLPAGTYFYVLSFRTGTIKQTLTIVRE